MVNYFKKRKMKKQFEQEGLLPITPSKPFKERYKSSKIGKAQKSVYGFVDYVSQEGRGKSGKGKGKRKNPFGKIKDRSFFEGGFF